MVSFGAQYGFLDDTLRSLHSCFPPFHFGRGGTEAGAKSGFPMVAGQRKDQWFPGPAPPAGPLRGTRMAHLLYSDLPSSHVLASWRVKSCSYMSGSALFARRLLIWFSGHGEAGTTQPHHLGCECWS